MRKLKLAANLLKYERHFQYTLVHFLNLLSLIVGKVAPRLLYLISIRFQKIQSSH